MTTALKPLNKKITLNASKERVWEVLLDDKYVRDWYRAFSEGAHADTDWKEGSKVAFKDDTGCGLVGRVITNRPYEEVVVEYDGVLVNGTEEYDSAMAMTDADAKKTALAALPKPVVPLNWHMTPGELRTQVMWLGGGPHQADAAADHQGRHQRGDAAGQVDHRAAGEVQDPKPGQPAVG